MPFEPHSAEVTYQCLACNTLTTVTVELTGSDRISFLPLETPYKCNDCHLNYTL
jgi:DNA-directed RNA polymerase subunit RPC12/RpoP